MCSLDHADEASLGNIKTESQRQPAELLISGRCGTQFVAMIIKLVYPYCGMHIVVSYCKESSISVTNWLKYLFSS